MRVAFLTGVVLFLSVLLVPSYGIVVADNPDNHVVTPPSAFDMVGKLPGTAGGTTTGVLIDPWHVLTAKHAVHNYASGTFVLDLADGSHSYSWNVKSEHSSADLAVLTLSSSTGLAGYPIYTNNDETYKEIIMVGYGVSGIGHPDSANYPKGVVMRYGYNRVDSIYNDNGLEYLLSDFDTAPANKEVMMADGDSGGPSFIDVGGVYYIAGIHHGVSDNDDDGIYPEFHDYGFDVRVSDYSDWIMQQVPEPISMLLFAVGFGLVRKKSHRI